MGILLSLIALGYIVFAVWVVWKIVGQETTKRRKHLLGGAAALLALSATIYYLDHQSTMKEMVRLSGIAREELDRMKVPARTIHVYQEVSASASCRASRVERLFASDLPIIDICESILLHFKAEGWESPHGCGTFRTPVSPIPAAPRQLSFETARFRAGIRRNGSFLNVGVSAFPRDSWPPYPGLSGHVEYHGVPAAKAAGPMVFGVWITYIEDPALYGERCPTDSPRCACDYRRLPVEFASAGVSK